MAELHSAMLRNYDESRANTAVHSDMAKKQKFPHLVGSKWTAQQPTMGWRHFQVTNRKNQGSWVFAELVAACDPGVRFWLNAKLLKDQSLWQSGWKSLNELISSSTETL
jgi:tryptophan-rich hypothetical protein